MDFLAKGSLGRNKRFPSFLGAGVLNKRSEGIAKITQPQNHFCGWCQNCVAGKERDNSHCEGLQDGLVHMPISRVP